MKTGITILVVMFVSITILLIMVHTLKSGEKYTDLSEIRDECVDISESENENTLTATCAGQIGRYFFSTESSLSIPCPTGYIVKNNNGVLICAQLIDTPG